MLTPLVVNGDNKREDHVRPFPSFSELLRRIAYRLFPDGATPDLSQKISPPFWIGGMFMGFRHRVFHDIGVLINVIFVS